jgi:hypothetical protein
MGLDLYAGTLGRYYSRNWQTIAEKELGAELIYPDSAPSYPSLIEANKLVVQWRTYLKTQVDSLAGLKLDWSNNDDIPYATDKPDFEGWVALILWAAYSERSDLQRPTARMDVLDWEADVAYSEALLKKYYFNSMAAIEAQIVVPGDRATIALAKDIHDNEIVVATTGLLRRSLERINALSWKTHTENVLVWRSDGLPTDEVYVKRTKTRSWPWKSKKEEFVKEQIPYPSDPMQQAAKMAFSIYWRMLEFSEKHNVPIVVDK